MLEFVGVTEPSEHVLDYTETTRIYNEKPKEISPEMERFFKEVEREERERTMK